MCWERGHHPPHTESPSHLNRVSAGGPENGIICIYHAMSLMCVFIVALFIPKLLLPFSPCPPFGKAAATEESSNSGIEMYYVYTLNYIAVVYCVSYTLCFIRGQL